MEPKKSMDRKASGGASTAKPGDMATKTSIAQLAAQMSKIKEEPESDDEYEEYDEEWDDG